MHARARGARAQVGELEQRSSAPALAERSPHSPHAAVHTARAPDAGPGARVLGARGAPHADGSAEGALLSLGGLNAGLQQAARAIAELGDSCAAALTLAGTHSVGAGGARAPAGASGRAPAPAQQQPAPRAPWAAEAHPPGTRAAAPAAASASALGGGCARTPAAGAPVPPPAARALQRAATHEPGLLGAPHRASAAEAEARAQPPAEQAARTPPGSQWACGGAPYARAGAQPPPSAHAAAGSSFATPPPQPQPQPQPAAQRAHEAGLTPSKPARRGSHLAHGGAHCATPPPSCPAGSVGGSVPSTPRSVGPRLEQWRQARFRLTAVMQVHALQPQQLGGAATPGAPAGTCAYAHAPGAGGYAPLGSGSCFATPPSASPSAHYAAASSHLQPPGTLSLPMLPQPSMPHHHHYAQQQQQQPAGLPYYSYPQQQAAQQQYLPHHQLHQAPAGYPHHGGYDY